MRQLGYECFKIDGGRIVPLPVEPGSDEMLAVLFVPTEHELAQKGRSRE